MMLLLMIMMTMMTWMGQVDGCNSSTLMACLQLDTAVDLFDRFDNHSLFPAYDNHTLDSICRYVSNCQSMYQLLHFFSLFV